MESLAVGADAAGAAAPGVAGLPARRGKTQSF